MVLSSPFETLWENPLQLASRQFGVGDYFCLFQLGEEYDRDRINAKLDLGVLTVTIPKREDAKPKRIAIQA